MKKFLVILLSLFFVLGLAACGSSDSGNVSDREPSGTPVASEPENVPETEPESDSAAPDEGSEVPSEEPAGNEGGKTLVVYFSATGNTEEVANHIVAVTGADVFELEPVNAYTDDDLDYNDDSSRVVREHDNPEEQDVELVASTVENWDEYDTVFIGYPIWWHIAAWPVNGFVEANDFTGKTVIPFCTSASSGLGESGDLLEEMAGTGDWLEGQRFGSRASEDDVRSWIDGLGLDSDASGSSMETAGTVSDNKTLVVYFSMPETTDPDNMTQDEDNSVVVIDGEVLGNTQYVAYVIQENTGADIFRIEPETPYPTDHDTLVDLAAEEQNQAARPAIKDRIENLEQYDTVFVGYPNWWGDMPMILYSFFDEYDFAGKTIVPFNTHGGSGFSNTISTIAGLEPDAVVNTNGFTVSRNNVQEAEGDIIAWLNENGF